MSVHILQVDSGLSLKNNIHQVRTFLPQIKQGDLVILPLLAFWSTNGEMSIQELGSLTKEWAKETARTQGCSVIVGYTDVFGRSAAVGFNEEGMKVIDCLEGHWNEVDFLRTDTTSDKLNIIVGTSGDLCTLFLEYVLRRGFNFVVFLLEYHLEGECAGDTSDLKTISLWAAALTPLLEAERKYPIDVVFANRAGDVGSFVYSGTSTAFRIQNRTIELHAASSPQVDLLTFPMGTEMSSKGQIRFRLIKGELIPIPPELQVDYLGAPIDTTPIHSAPIDEPCSQDAINGTRILRPLVPFEGKSNNQVVCQHLKIKDRKCQEATRHPEEISSKTEGTPKHEEEIIVARAD